MSTGYRHRQHGFTLMELTMATLIIAVLSFSFLGGYSFLARTNSQLATRDRLERLRVALGAAYRNNARTIEASTAREVLLGPGVAILDGTDASNGTTLAALDRVAGFGQLSPMEARVDDFQRRFLYVVSDRIAINMPGGYSVYYRKIGIVSRGYNGQVDAGTSMDPATGAVTVGGDDSAVVVDGFQIQRELAEQTVAKVDRIAKAYERYFTNRYLANLSRDVSIDYFAAAGATAARWDAGGLAANSGGAFADGASLNLTQALGLATSDLRDAYGTPIQVDNSSATTRNPENPASAMSIPPYSALVRANLTAGQTYVQSAIGSF
jgi:prepilin-type N-terminal cleavage/methylation domain-containing protein